MAEPDKNGAGRVSGLILRALRNDTREDCLLPVHPLGVSDSFSITIEASLSPEAFSRKLHAMGIVHEAVED